MLKILILKSCSMILFSYYLNMDLIANSFKR